MMPRYGDQDGPERHHRPDVVPEHGRPYATVTRGPWARQSERGGLLKLPNRNDDVSLKVGRLDRQAFTPIKDGMLRQSGRAPVRVVPSDLRSGGGARFGREVGEVHGRRAQPSLPPGARKIHRVYQRKLRLWDWAEQDIEAIATGTNRQRTSLRVRHGQIEDR